MTIRAYLSQDRFPQDIFLVLMLSLQITGPTHRLSDFNIRQGRLLSEASRIIFKYLHLDLVVISHWGFLLEIINRAMLKVIIWTIKFSLFHIIAFIVALIVLGGGPVWGSVKNGVYLLGMKGVYTHVSQQTFWLISVWSISVIFHVLLVLVFFLLSMLMGSSTNPDWAELRRVFRITHGNGPEESGSDPREE
ncbi:MAG: hypothetical protein WC205_19580 [Opitutaceae bacterium]